MADTLVAPEWIVEGGKVAVVDYGAFTRVRESRVKKINKISITLDDGSRFSLRDLRETNRDVWAKSGKLLACDDPEVSKIIRAQRRRTRIRRAQQYIKLVDINEPESNLEIWMATATLLHELREVSTLDDEISTPCLYAMDTIIKAATNTLPSDKESS